ncbi:hypothetical protein ACLOJK_003757 [Asimina triloba]
MGVQKSSDVDEGGSKESTRLCFFEDDENIIFNPRFDDGLNNWSGRGCKILLHYSMGDEKVLPQAMESFLLLQLKEPRTEMTFSRKSLTGFKESLTGHIEPLFLLFSYTCSQIIAAKKEMLSLVSGQ